MFASFGLVYLGCIQYSIYVPLFSRLFPSAEAFATAPLRVKLADFVGQRRMLAQVFFDQMLHHPILYFPTFYVLKEVVNGGEPINGLRKYRENVTEDLAALWKLWLPTTVINFSFLPMWGRIPWVATTSLVWTCILSYMRGSMDDDVADAALAEDMTGNIGRAIERTLIWRESQQAAFYDERKMHLLLSANGPDRIGYISTLSAAVANASANVIDARMVKLGGDFSIMMLVTVEPDDAARLTAGIAAVEGMHVNVHQVPPCELPVSYL